MNHHLEEEGMHNNYVHVRVRACSTGLTYVCTSI